jgi:nitrile hydratase accessory protein
MTAAKPVACDLPGLPQDEQGPVFRAPWEAQAFALVLALHERGLFSWIEWASALSTAIQQAQAGGDPDLGDTYYQHWLAALEGLVLAKGLAGQAQLKALGQAWSAAAERTPHGQPITLNAAEQALAD